MISAANQCIRDESFPTDWVKWVAFFLHLPFPKHGLFFSFPKARRLKSAVGESGWLDKGRSNLQRTSIYFFSFSFNFAYERFHLQKCGFVLFKQTFRALICPLWKFFPVGVWTTNDLFHAFVSQRTDCFWGFFGFTFLAIVSFFCAR